MELQVFFFQSITFTDIFARYHDKHIYISVKMLNVGKLHAG